MRKKHVKKELQIKIKKYLEYALEVETSLDSNEAYLSAYLNQSLKNELITEIHSKTLLENLIFRRFDSSLIMKTSLIMKEKIYSPEDPVFFVTIIFCIHAHLKRKMKVKIQASTSFILEKLKSSILEQMRFYEALLYKILFLILF